MANKFENYGEWVIKVMKDLEDQRRTDRVSPVCIYNVPINLQNMKKEAYIPQAVSLGPYYFDNPQLDGTEQHKAEAARRVQSRIPGNKFISVVNKMQSMEKRIRDCYDEDIPYDQRVLSLMMARDGSFILELLKNIAGSKHSDGPSEPFNPIFDGNSTNPLLSEVIRDLFKIGNQIPFFVVEEIEVIRDLFKIGNQIPFFVVEEIVKMEIQKQPEKYLTDILNEFCSTFSPFSKVFAVGDKWKSLGTLAEIFRYSCVGTMKSDIEENDISRNPPPFPPTAAELHRAGVKLQSLPPEKGDINNIRFDEKISTLHLPQVSLGTYSEILMRNLMALEACSATYKGSRQFTPYVHFMDDLINSKDDVAVLRKHGIVVNYLGSDAQATELFNFVGQSISWSTPYDPIEKAKKGLSKHYQKRWKILWSEFWEGYCSKPWLVAGSLGATLLVFMTAIQVFCLFYTCNPK